MKHTILIQNFGPVGSAEIDLNKNFQVYIGAQASGKSTICKIVYFCQKIRDYTLDFLMDAQQFTENHHNEYFNNYMKYLTKQFMGCFGRTTHMKKFRIVYSFGNEQIQIGLNDGYVRYTLSESLKNAIYALIADAAGMFLHGLQDDSLKSIFDQVSAIGTMKQQLKRTLNDIFQNESDIIYIPAGRSLLATMSEQLQDFSITDMDLTMQEFIKLIRSTKSKFGSKIPEITKNYTKTVKGQINNTALEQAYSYIRKILKADYTSESDGEKIYFDEYHWVKLMYGSSGQQEVLWILMLIYITILENKKSFIIIEEPEAHLFPVAQKDVISMIALLVNSVDATVVLTTHSPYILTSLNILLYSDKVERHIKGNEGYVIPKCIRVPYNAFAAYKIENADGMSSLESLLDEESHMISTEYIDEVSTITNGELDELINMEIRNDL